MSLGSIKNGNEIEVADEGTTIIAYNDNDEKVIVPYNVLNGEILMKMAMIMIFRYF